MVVAGAALEENSKCYPQVLLGESLYDLQKCCNTIELIFQKELILIKQKLQKSVCFIIIGM